MGDFIRESAAGQIAVTLLPWEYESRDIRAPLAVLAVPQSISVVTADRRPASARPGRQKIARLPQVWPRHGGLRSFGLASPGPLRDRLNGLVLTGEKTATAGLWHQDYVEESEPLDDIGEREVLLDCDGKPLAHVEVLRVEVRRFIDVSLEFALAEGEGFESIEHWRKGHRSYWGGTGIVVDGDTQVVCVWFRVLAER